MDLVVIVRSKVSRLVGRSRRPPKMINLVKDESRNMCR